MKSLLIVIIILLSSISFSKENSAVVLMYHRFGQPEHPSTNINKELFAKQMNYLKENKFNVLPLSNLIDIFENNKPIPKKAVLITIDDGFKSVYTNAFSILKELNFPFSVFVSTKYVSNSHNSDFMSWDMLKELINNKGEIFNHSHDHKSLLNLSIKDARHTIEKTQVELKNNLGVVPTIFSYPYGEYSEEKKNLIKEMGFKLAFSQDSGPISIMHDQFSLQRFPINNNYGDLKRFKTIVETKSLEPQNFSPIDREIFSNRIDVSFLTNFKSENINCFSNNSSELIKENNNDVVHLQLKKLDIGRNYRLNCTLIKNYNNRREIYWFGTSFFVRPRLKD
tara:strand:+ start:10089 stop:11102 length:1014 start_codon:yes stop_codon:yes gene_type:complete